MGSLGGSSLSHPYRKTRIPVTGWKKCLSGNPSCLSLVSFVPTPLSYTHPLLLSHCCTFHNTPKIILASQHRKTRPQMTPLAFPSPLPFILQILYGKKVKYILTDVSLWCLQNKEEKEFVEVCKRLMANLIDGECDLTWQQHNNKVQFERVTINGKGRAHLIFTKVISHISQFIIATNWK